MESLSIIVDPRIDRRRKHDLVEVIVLAICGVLCGCNQWIEIEEYANDRIDFFKTILKLENGVPSHDTFGRIFSILDPVSFQQAFFEWTNSLREAIGQQVVAIDGKFLNGSMREAGRARSAIQIVSAWATESGVFLGQTKSELKKEQGEKRATEELLDILFLKGCITTMDANAATPRITQKVIIKGADYLIGLKKNQKALLSFAERLFENAPETADFCNMEKGHGRHEDRQYWQANLESEEFKKHLIVNSGLAKKWPSLKSFIRVTSSRTIKGKTSTETRYYFTSLSNNIEVAAKAIRSHWAVENSLHYVLDVFFKEDQSRVRIKHAAENFGLIRRFVLNMLKQFTDPKGRKFSIKSKRNHCHWRDTYLLQVLNDARVF